MFQTHIFSSGLRLLTIPVKEVQTVSVLVLVRVGSRYETEKTNGLAHFCEHIFFQGNDKWPDKLSLSTEIDQIGAEFNGMTGKEYTGYFVKAENKHLNLSCEILYRMLWHSKFESAQIEREKGVIVEEINYRSDMPQIAVDDMVTEALFKGNPLGLSGAGEKEAVQKFKRKDFVNFHKDYYHRKNVFVVVAGKFEENAVFETISKHFSQVPEGEVIKPATFYSSSRVRLDEKSSSSRQVRLGSNNNVIVKEKSTDQTHFCLGAYAFKKTSPKRYSQSILNIILGSGMSSRLFQKIREEKSLAYYVGSDVESYTDTGMFTVSAGVNGSKLEEAVKTVIEELSLITKSGNITAKELRKTKDYLRGKLVLSLEESLEQAMFYGLSWLLEDKIRSVEEIIAQVEKVTEEEVTAVARDLFKRENFKLGVVGKDVL
ncbi:insulinase family protein [Candidatus Gottesmanbacteria bacterium]|nr:insulinase family protein [Candidatus Gottesmanbacteria bacterium]